MPWEIGPERTPEGKIILPELQAEPEPEQILCHLCGEFQPAWEFGRHRLEDKQTAIFCGRCHGRAYRRGADQLSPFEHANGVVDLATIVRTLREEAYGRSA